MNGTRKVFTVGNHKPNNNSSFLTGLGAENAELGMHDLISTEMT